jgi:hypothetical protein
MNIGALQAYFVATFRTKQVRARENNSVVKDLPRDWARFAADIFTDCNATALSVNASMLLYCH